MIYKDYYLGAVEKACLLLGRSRSLSKKRSAKRMLVRAIERSRVEKNGYVGKYRIKHDTCVMCTGHSAGDFMECPFHLDD